MAEKYIDISATYNGDGSSSAQAASAGAAGAWNDILAVMTAAPTYGTLSGGDVVHIRTADGSGDLGVTISATKTMLARGDYATFVTWEFDDGTIWANSGTFTFTTTGNYRIDFAENTKILGKDKNCKFYWDATTNYYYWMYLAKRNLFIDVEFEFGTVNGKTPYLRQPISGFATFVDCLFDMKALPTIEFLRVVNYNTDMYFLGCYFDCNNLNGSGKMILNPQTIGNRYYFYGGGYLNVNTVAPNLIATTMNSNYYTTYVVAEGFDFQGIDTETYTHETTSSAQRIGTVNLLDYTAGFNFYSCTDMGRLDWFKGKSYPTLNATLPDGTAWSIRCKNGYDAACHMTAPFVDNIITLNSGAGNKKLTLELLIADAITSPTDRDFFIQVSYFDVNNVVRWETSRSNISPSALTSSTASWSTTTYDGKTFTKYKIEHTLDYEIAADCLIEVVIGSGRSQVTSDDWYFIDPDITIEDA